MELAYPQWLWGLLVLPLVALGEWWLVHRDRERTAHLVARALWPRVVERPAEAWRWVRLGLVLVAVAGLVLALARPRWGMVREKLERQGVDVVLVADTSASMLCTDTQPSRFIVARAALAALLDHLAGDRFALVALEGEAYPLVPLTLDADAVGLFLDTMEPGIVPTPGTSLGAGLARALDLFVDTNRANKVIVLASDGEDLEGGVEVMVAKAKQMGVVVHTLAVGTDAGGPVPDLDRDGRQVGFKKDEAGSTVVSRLNAANLEAMARATGGKSVRLLPSQPLAWEVVSAIEGMEHQTLAKEYAYRKKERFQWPLGFAVVTLTLGLLLPPPRRRRARAAAAIDAGENRGRRPGVRGAAGTPTKLGATVLMLLAAGVTAAQEAGRGGGVVDEALLRPTRATSAGRTLYDEGNYPKALERFTEAASFRPEDARARFNLADALFKAGKLDEAAAIFRALGERDDAPLAFESRYNLGNVELSKQQFPAAVGAYRKALKLRHDDPDTRRNLELALRAIQQQQQNPQQQHEQQQDERQQPSERQQQSQQDQHESKEQQEHERYQREAGMPKEQAMQLLSALEQTEKEQQRKQLQALRSQRKKGKDW
ncbi:MAG: VWA domain-containing protein [Thermoanaerobaculaceae bacterium]|nr:VWA domain-containing protein [Thermoanaerobaculaceae bacterium]MDI9621433.1 VWA domain-containing protein [Acidobacteriota bacterium]NLH12332.1 VWA domain-containing protein [Holophagae bacterium]HPW55482.1 VWA domain-containing protein [Thermoanaerobaculaceae bacterium]